MGDEDFLVNVEVEPDVILDVDEDSVSKLCYSILYILQLIFQLLTVIFYFMLCSNDSFRSSWRFFCSLNISSAYFYLLL